MKVLVPCMVWFVGTYNQQTTRYRLKRNDLDNYAQIMVETSALKQNNNPAEVTPKSSRGWKWKNIFRHIWRDRSKYEGRGITSTIVIPSDPIALVDKLHLLLASNVAGNTGVRNEIVSICDELLRLG